MFSCYTMLITGSSTVAVAGEITIYCTFTIVCSWLFAAKSANSNYKIVYMETLQQPCLIHLLKFQVLLIGMEIGLYRERLLRIEVEDGLFYLVAPLTMVTVCPQDLISSSIFI